MNQQPALFSDQHSVVARPQLSLKERAQYFCTNPPYRHRPFVSRNWGAPLHSLCSYQGKLKPAIAHFLVAWFTEPGNRVADLMAGVGTIPLEARRLGRFAIANDLSPLAYAVSSAKVLPVTEARLDMELHRLTRAVKNGRTLRDLESTTDLDWGLNGAIRSYFHPDTLRELLLAREYFRHSTSLSAERQLLQASMMHILHGNRPYALSRRSHPVTPFAPTGPFEYRPLLGRLSNRLSRIAPSLLSLARNTPSGESSHGDFRDLVLRDVDAIITSPPFARSIRFWSSNWLRLWFAGWEAFDFKVEPARYVETEQRSSYAPYRDFSKTASAILRSGGRLILHLGETPSENMVDHIRPLLETDFSILYAGRENVKDLESHGLRDKGATTAHWYLFAEKR